MREFEIIPVHIRWMIRRDMPEVLDIESHSFEFPWSAEDFKRCLCQRNSIGLVAEHDEQVVGFTIYELHKTRLHLLNLAVSPECQRRGVGMSIMARMLRKLSHDRRNRILLEVRESNLSAQQFFRSCGMRAVSVLPGFYDDTDEDAYLMQFDINEDFAKFPAEVIANSDPERPTDPTPIKGVAG